MVLFTVALRFHQMAVTMPRDPAEWKKAADEASTKELALVCFGIYAGMKMAIEDQKRADQKSKEST